MLPDMSTRVGATAYLPTTKGRTDAWRRYADDPAMLLHLIACRWGSGLLVIEHRVEQAQIRDEVLLVVGGQYGIGGRGVGDVGIKQ